MDAESFLALAGDQNVEHELEGEADEAMARGVSGAPTFSVGNDMFLDQERLALVVEAGPSHLDDDFSQT